MTNIIIIYLAIYFTQLLFACGSLIQGDFASQKVFLLSLHPLYPVKSLIKKYKELPIKETNV
jgi:hypothetical protein